MKTKAKQSIKTSKKTKVFFLFLILSFLIWVPIKLSKLYTDAVYLNLVPENLPIDKLILAAPDYQIKVSVEQMSGFELFRNRLSTPKLGIDLQSLKKLNNRTYYVLTDNLIDEISSKLTSEMKLLSISPDTIFYELGVSRSKKVPVLLDIEIDFVSGYGLTEEMEFTPHEIEISGPENLIDTISEIKTSMLVLTEVQENIATNIDLIKVGSEKVNYSQTSVSIVGNVEKFTETRIKIPVAIANVPDELKLTTIPTEVEIVYQVPISKFKRIKPEDFKISCDYNRSKKNNLDYLIPELISAPNGITSVKIIPNQIEYFITE